MSDDQGLVAASEGELIELVESAVQATIKKEIDILKKGRVERSFNSYLANEIGSRIKWKNIRADPFYNKHIDAAKRLNGNLIELDVAVHQRNVDTNNLVAIELETSNTPAMDDLWKIEGLTQELGGYGYKLGLYIVFGVSQKAGLILSKKWFRNGKFLRGF